MSAAKREGWIDDLKRRTAMAGGGILVIAAVGAFLSGWDQFFRSYLLGFVFWAGIAFGCLALQMLHALTGGGWGMPVRRVLWSGSTTLPLFFVLFVPILIGVHRVYPWAAEGALEDPVLRHKAAYLNVPFFAARAIGCLAIWTGLAIALYRRSVKRGLDRQPGASMKVLSGPGILVCALTMSMAAIDWLMSLEPHWYSTMFPVIVIVGQLLGAVSFVVCLMVIEKQKNGDEVPIAALHDLGNLMLVFVMLWAYVSFSQYLIIYAGNLAEETPFYVHRTDGGWQAVALSLVLLHFAVPFLLLLSRRTKQSPRVLSALAAFVLVMRLVDLFWIAAPAFYGHELHMHWLDLALPLGIGAVWLAFFFHRFGRPELTPRAA
jgi:hypothetical protein